MPKIFQLIILFVFLFTGQACAAQPITGASVELTVAAAADLQFAFTEIGMLFEQQTGHKVTFVFGSTGQLAQQIENGAPYDLFAAANVAFVNGLAQKSLVFPDSVVLYARGRVVLAVNRALGIKVVTLDDLLSDEITHIAIANPEHAPYGVAAKEALQAAGLWEQIRPKLVYGENVRQALQFIQTGDAQAGIVALSVANAPEVSWSLIDDSLHNPLDQALAVVMDSPNQEAARQLAAFINSPSGRLVMQKYGFTLPDEAILTPIP